MRTPSKVFYWLLFLNLLAPKIWAASDAALDMKVNALLGKMTLAEKIGQMVQYNTSATASVEAQGDWTAKQRG